MNPISNDVMYTIGIIGGRSSGKSTLANALAGTMFSRVTAFDGTAAKVEYNGRIKIIDCPPITCFDSACALSDELETVDILVIIANVAWWVGNPAIIGHFKDRVAARNAAGYYQMLVSVVGKYDFEDLELDELIGSTEIRRICALKLSPAPSNEDWAVRESIKAGRFKGELTSHEREILALATADDTITAARKCAVLNYMSKNGAENIQHICALLKHGSGDPAIYMTKIADRIRHHNIGTQYVYLRKYGEVLGLSRLEYMSYLSDSHLKCPVFAAQNDRARLAKYLYADDVFESIPLNIEMQLPWARTSYIRRTSYADICAVAGSSDVQEIIKEITNESLREYFQLCFCSYEELLADIVAGNYETIEARVIGAGVDWNNFRRRLSADYFVHYCRGTVHKLICDCAQC